MSTSSHFQGSGSNATFTFNKPMSVVFIGNIPYDTTEEQLLSLFGTVGPVQSLRLVFDRDTGKPKGYGFCEYQDTETARACVRNLSNYELNGRNLRLDFADSMLGAPKDVRKENKAARSQRPVADYADSGPPSSSSSWDPFASGAGQPHGQPPMMMMPPGGEGSLHHVPPPPPPMAYFQQPFMQQPHPPHAQMMGAHPPPVPPAFPTPQTSPPQPFHPGFSGFQPPPSQFAPNAPPGYVDPSHHPSMFVPLQEPLMPPPPPPSAPITALESLPPDQLFSLLSHIKNLTQSQPSQAKELLSSNPHLTYALFHILWRMDLIDAQTIQRTISSLTGTESSSSAPPDPRSQDPRKSAPAEPVKTEQHQTLLEQIRRMTPEQIEALPPEQREKILLLKSKV